MWRSNSRNANSSKSDFKKKLKDYNKELEADEIAQNNALIGFYYRINPDKLTDNQWSKKVAELHWVLKFNGTLVSKE